ncbi:DUF2490 domain-containing protein [Flagellimonas zhangzhouensis]|uniref:DUF2490 domain-containing protein n=1 Tax=Flagellimonas zhangzhouensis TaxID=1073328 RepID=A0A1H2RM44_9FLAO|nr:DUF2490 domain-containing protein [Allomuricauda zhangzhouensis]SDQ65381.1 Protein of unknown function [Allomuricauda zhangzhouensis]SDW20375.1 Protein of unknown function [Allomuricauda zhangzhouensis]
MIKNLTALFLLFGLLTVNAQQPGEDELGAWYMYFGTNKVSKRLSVHTEAQFRLYETTSNFNQLLLRTGLNYHISPEAIATAGYGYIDTDNTFYDGDFDINLIEHRIFEQFILKNKVWELLFEHRYRLEQRFLDLDGVKDTQHRARYRIQMTLPLTDTFFLNFYDELFINLQDDLFGQNRLYGAVGVNITENSNIQIGYLRNQFSNAVYDRLQFAVFYNPDLSSLFKKKKP